MFTVSSSKNNLLENNKAKIVIKIRKSSAADVKITKLKRLETISNIVPKEPCKNDVALFEVY